MYLQEGRNRAVAGRISCFISQPGLCLASRTDMRLCFIAMIAAIKNVLSPISDSKIIPEAFTNPWPARTAC